MAVLRCSAAKERNRSQEARVDTTKRSESTSVRASPSDAALPQRPSYFFAHPAKMRSLARIASVTLVSVGLQAVEVGMIPLPPR
jgi:hypothetical protein